MCIECRRDFQIPTADLTFNVITNLHIHMSHDVTYHVTRLHASPLPRFLASPLPRPSNLG